MLLALRTGSARSRVLAAEGIFDIAEKTLDTPDGSQARAQNLPMASQALAAIKLGALKGSDPRDIKLPALGRVAAAVATFESAIAGAGTAGAGSRGGPRASASGGAAANVAKMPAGASAAELRASVLLGERKPAKLQAAGKSPLKALLPPAIPVRATRTGCYRPAQPEAAAPTPLTGFGHSTRAASAVVAGSVAAKVAKLDAAAAAAARGESAPLRNLARCAASIIAPAPAGGHNVPFVAALSPPKILVRLTSNGCCRAPVPAAPLPAAVHVPRRGGFLGRLEAAAPAPARMVAVK